MVSLLREHAPFKWRVNKISETVPLRSWDSRGQFSRGLPYRSLSTGQLLSGQLLRGNLLSG